MEIGLFPLGIVLLPTEQVPLHIFEPRYRELIAECLERGRAVRPRLRRRRRPAERARSRSVVEVVERFDDGRLNIVVEGGERFRLVELTDGRSFHTGTIEPLARQRRPADPGRRRRARLGALRAPRRAHRRGGRGSGRGGGSRRSRSPSRFELAPELKLELLEEPQRAPSAEAALRDPRDGRRGRSSGSGRRPSSPRRTATAHPQPG